MPSTADIQRVRRRRGLWAIGALALAYAVMMQPIGWAQTSHYALVRALSHGTAKIDAYQWETKDKSWYHGHFYSVKGPGLALFTLPLYEGLHAVGGESASRWAARRAIDNGGGRWSAGGRPSGLYGQSLQRAYTVRRTIQDETALVWVLGLLGAVLPAFVLLLLVRNLAERVEPGLGTAAAVTLGVGTLVMPFATLYFSHLLAAVLGFGAFALAWREREGSPRLRLLAAAGLCAGLAVTTEYPLALAGGIVGLYTLSRDPGAAGLRERLRRAGAYAGGVVAGLVPLALYNLWAFGSITHMSYADAVKVQGLSGHAVLGLNDGGFFGIGMPTPHRLAQILFAPRGLLVLSPVLVLGAVGTVLMYRRGRRAEALTIGAVAVTYVIYNAGYYLPFGGGSPGPRFLIPMLPFLAVPLGLAFRRFPALTLALAVPSAGFALVSTTTMPLIGFDWAGYWAFWLGSGTFEHTIATLAGAGNGWGGILPFILLVAVAIGLAIAVSDRLTLAGDALYAMAAVPVWACLALAAPDLLADDYHGQYANGWQALVATFGAAAFTLVAASALLERRPWRELSLARPEQIDHEPVPAYPSQRQSP